jgi:DNA-binding response OmpR family regulator
MSTGSGKQTRILVIEDNQRIAHFVEKGFTSSGYVVEVCRDGGSGLEALRATPPDLVVLDLGLPDMDGMEVLATLRTEGHAMPVVVLTARGEIPDRVAGFESGADDYMTKPFAFAELLVRVRARLREEPRGESQELVHGDLSLHVRTRQAHTPDLGARELSNREYALLERMMLRPAETHTREDLLRAVWGIDFDPQSNVVDVYIRYLRIKIGSHRIETVRGGGYRMAAPTP